MKKYNARDISIQFLNEFYATLNVKECNMVRPNHDASELQIISAMKEAGATKEEIDLFIEKCDVDREQAISLFREGRLRLNESKELVYKLVVPLNTDEGVGVIKELTLKTRVKAKDVSAQLKFATDGDIASIFIAKLAPRVGVKTLFLNEMDEEDIEYLMIIHKLFQRAKLPIE